jgi:hypothetical protein
MEWLGEPISALTRETLANQIYVEPSRIPNKARRKSVGIGRCCMSTILQDVVPLQIITFIKETMSVLELKFLQ